MNVIATDVPDVLIIEPKVFGDQRGFFLETYQFRRYAEFGINRPFVQDNASRSSYGVLRGLHLQNPSPQGKLVSVAASWLWRWMYASEAQISGVTLPWK